MSSANIALARNAMATRFELLLHGGDPVRLRAAGEEALAEVERLEAQLSLFRPTSEVAHINARAALEPVPVTPEVFSLLTWAARLAAETQGLFDITVGPLVRCWGFHHGTGRVPAPEELAEARARTGMHLVELDEAQRTVCFHRPGVFLDLGALGKGYAIERAAILLREAGVQSALIHGGTSTAYGLGTPPDQAAWKVAIDNPPGITHPPGPTLATVSLKDEALSVSAVWGRSFEHDGRHYGHVLDPRDGQPVARAVLAAVVLPSATESDALSTALLTTGLEGHRDIAGLRPEIKTLVAAPQDQTIRVRAQGIAPAWGKHE